MKTTLELFQSYKIPMIKSRRSERSDLLQSFLDTINAGRVNTKYKPLTIPYIGHLLSIYSTSDLYILKQKCDRAKNFSATFFYFVKPKQI